MFYLYINEFLEFKTEILLIRSVLEKELNYRNY
jgi:hypothetical protein